MSWSGNASHPENLDEDEQIEPGQEDAHLGTLDRALGASQQESDAPEDVPGDVISHALHPATLVRRKVLTHHRSHPKPLAPSRMKAPQDIARISEDAERLLEDFVETGRAIQARRLTMSLARALEADLGHWEHSIPERTDCLPGLSGYLDHLQSLCQPLLTCLITGGAWAEGEFSLCCTAPLDYLANPVLLDPFSARKGLLPWLRFYPVILLAFGLGIAAVAGRRYQTLARLFREVTMPDPFGIDRCSLPVGLHAWSGVEPEIIRQLPGFSDQGGLIDHLYSILEPPLRDLAGRPALYDQAFDQFSLLLTCAYADEILTPGHSLTWIPQERLTGSVLTVGMATRLETEARAEGEAWPPLRAGLFRGSAERFLELLHRVQVLRGNRLDDREDETID